MINDGIQRVARGGLLIIPSRQHPTGCAATAPGAPPIEKLPSANDDVAAPRHAGPGRASENDSQNAGERQPRRGCRGRDFGHDLNFTT